MSRIAPSTRRPPLAHAPHSLRLTPPVARRVGQLDVPAIALLAITVVLVYASFRVLWPFATAIVLGAWAAQIARPVFRRLDKALHGRPRAAAVLTGGLVLVVASPIALAVTTLVPAAKSLVEQLRSAGGGRGALTALVSSSGSSGRVEDVVQLVKEHAEDASRAAALVAGASVQAVIGVFVFFVVFYAMLVSGPRLSAWSDKNAPIDAGALARMRDAFYQAGRGLLIGNGITALVQGGIATITYVALGVPRALLLGFASVICALIPLTGPTIVWIPVALGLLLTGHPVKALILAVVGVAVVGTVDNVLRPYLAKRAHVGLDTSIVLVSIFGGIALLGGWGLLLGPLVVRLAVEALAIMRERGLGVRKSATDA